MPRLRLPSLACCALHCFSRGAGKRWEKGKVGPEKQLSRGAAAEARSGAEGGRSTGRPVLLLLPLLTPLPYWVLTVQAAAVVM